MNRNYQVIHLSTSHKGGAGIAARRLNSELNRKGVKSTFYAIERSDFIKESHEVSIKRSFMKRIFSYLSMFIGRKTLNIAFFSVFSSPGVTHSWIQRIIEAENTIIHIHNWFNLLSFSQLQKLLASGVPVVVTMHDQRLMTGGCHVTLDCDQFKYGCHSCPRITNILRSSIRRNSKTFRKFFSEIYPNLQLVAPSRFMIGESAKSQILEKQEVLFVSNPIPQEFFMGTKARAHNSENIFRVGVASANPLDPLKGGDLIEDLSRIIDETIHGIRLVYLADFEMVHQRDFWEQIDCLIVPSRGDNSPNVIHEAKGFCIPVIASNVGGIPELLHYGFDIEMDINKISKELILESILAIKDRNHNSLNVTNMRKAYSGYNSQPLDNLTQIYDRLFDVTQKKI